MNSGILENSKDDSGLLGNTLDFLLRVQGIVNAPGSVEHTLETAFELLRTHLSIIEGAVYIADETRGLMCLAATTEAIREGTGETSVLRGILTNQAPLLIPEIGKEEALAGESSPWRSADGTEMSFLGVPLLIEDRAVGALAVTFTFRAGQNHGTVTRLVSLVASSLVRPILQRNAMDNERQKLLAENVILKQKLQEEYSFHNLIGNSHEMRDVYEQVARVARTNTTVLLRGESGTGKELIAEAIHYNSLRGDGPFIRVNCAAVPETLIESEFFGYEKGAFTGAVGRKAGRFERADRGTIFLDEIGELSPMTQVKLLRVLQDQTFERVGGTETLRVDVRLIAATNSDLESSIREGVFREDLYYRLNIFSIYMPPLRDRKTDILLLADHFLQKYSRQHAKAVKRISTPAIDMLMRYHWPGNVRELENCIERAVIVCEDQVLHGYHLPPTLQTAESSGTLPSLSLKEAVRSYERELIQDALKSTRGNRAKAARLLGTTERIINYKIRNLVIDHSRFKP